MKLVLKLVIQAILLCGAFRLGMFYTHYQTVRTWVPSESRFFEEVENTEYLLFSVGQYYERDGSVPLRIEEKDKIEEFLALIDINEGKIEKPKFVWTGWSLKNNQCMCHGDVKMLTSKAAFSYHHLKSLRWLDGPWENDAPLTEQSASKINDWLQNEGFTVIEQFKTTNP